MKRLDRKLFIFYLWVALGYFFMGLLNTWTTHPGRFLPVVLNNIWGIAFLLPVNIILFEYTIPFILKKGRAVFFSILLGILLLVVHLMVYSYGAYAWRLLGIQMNIYTALKAFPTVSQALQNTMAYSTASAFFFGIVRHIYTYTKLKQATQQLRIEKQAAELSFLKSQTNPHFLFNTLNNIYSLARDKSDRAPESILRLSKILRFMLYETGGAYISIEQELKVIADYIELESLRYDEGLRIQFTHDIEDMKQALPPLLLMPLVENAFKHGVSETRGNRFIDIHASVRSRQLIFAVKNSSEVVTSQGVKENIGLSNLRRQLELLYRDYTLSLKQSDAQFTATLTINLASHV